MHSRWFNLQVKSHSSLETLFFVVYIILLSLGRISLATLASYCDISSVKDKTMPKYVKYFEE
jgi:hypothetical protein